jgi:hypothetical protein
MARLAMPRDARATPCGSQDLRLGGAVGAAFPGFFPFAVPDIGLGINRT